MIHPLSDVQSLKIGNGTRIWQYVIVLKDAVIGNDCNINCHVLIENKVTIGNNVTIKPGVYVWDGITIEDDVFVGPNVTFTNDKYPKSKNASFQLLETTLKKGCSIGANTTLLCGITIGENSLIGAGSLVTKNVPDNELWMGSPAKFIRKIN